MQLFYIYFQMPWKPFLLPGAFPCPAGCVCGFYRIIRRCQSMSRHVRRRHGLPRCPRRKSCRKSCRAVGFRLSCRSMSRQRSFADCLHAELPRPHAFFKLFYRVPRSFICGVLFFEQGQHMRRTPRSPQAEFLFVGFGDWVEEAVFDHCL